MCDKMFFKYLGDYKGDGENVYSNLLLSVLLLECVGLKNDFVRDVLKWAV